MGTAHFEEHPDSMDMSAELPLDEQPDTVRRLHLHDITNAPSPEAVTVGAELRQARLRRGEDMNAIANALRIRRSQLEALEEGHQDKLPGRAYAVGFIRTYAEYLGLDPMSIVARYKAELDGMEGQAEEFSFPKVGNYRQLPRGTFLIVGIIIALGVYGAWLLVKSADRIVAERVPPVPAQIAENAGGTSDQSVRSLSGDPASAAIRTYEPVRPDAVAVYEVPPTATPAQPSAQSVPAGALPTDVALLQSQPGSVAGAQALLAPSRDVAVNPAPLPPLPAGQAYGSDNLDGRVVVRARKSDAWLRVEDAEGHVLIERTLQPGDSYRAPSAAGVIMVARDASAFELMVDGTSLGLAGPPTLVLTGKKLEAAALLAAMPQPVQVSADAETVNPTVNGR